MPSGRNRAFLAAAGSGKTSRIVREALAYPSSERMLITTYTNANADEIRKRMAEGCGGVIPRNVEVRTLIDFLLNEMAKPYQSSVLEEINYIRGYNLTGTRRERVSPETSPRQYFCDTQRGIYRDGLSELICRANDKTNGLVLSRFSECYDRVYIDEFQDLTGWDPEVVGLMLDSSVDLTLVGDPRQATMKTSRSRKNSGLADGRGFEWLEKNRPGAYELVDDLTTSYRCSEEICRLADGLYPELPRTESALRESRGHAGVFVVRPTDARAYYEAVRPQVLRDKVTSETVGLEAMNFGVSKGMEFDDVLIFPTGTMKATLSRGESLPPESKSKLYVAITRARFSAAFVMEAVPNGMEMWEPGRPAVHERRPSPMPGKTGVRSTTACRHPVEIRDVKHAHMVPLLPRFPDTPHLPSPPSPTP